jgi:ribonucleoside-triphosphate reductase
MFQVLKRDKKTKEVFQEQKVRKAIESAYHSIGKELDEEVLKCVFDRLGVNEQHEDVVLNVEDIQDSIEKCLFENDVEVAISFHDYRLTHKLIRDERKGLAREFAKKLMAENVENQNANLDEYSFSGRMAEASNVYKKDFALNNCVSKQTKRNHLNNESYVHDLDNYASGEHNCLSLPLDDLLANGAKVGQTDIRPAASINSAMQLTAVYFQIQSQEQFGGISATHVDWTMVPYVRKSFFKHYVLNYIKGQEDFDTLSVISMNNDEIDEWVDKHKEDFLKKFNLTTEDFRFDNFDNLDKHLANAALFDTRIELMQAVEALIHNLNTLQSRPGSQLPFSSLNYGSCTLPEGQMVIEALLDGSIRGTGKNHLTPIFPCGIFQLGKGINRKPGDPNYYLFRKALQSTAKRIYPNYANIDWSGNKGYDKNNPCSYFSTMGKRKLQPISNLVNPAKGCEPLRMVC